MTAGRGKVIASIAVATAVVASAVATASAVTKTERPRGAVADCSSVSGFGDGLRDFKLPQSLVVGPLAVLGAKPMLGFSAGSPYGGGNKLFVLVKGGHRVTLELSRETRRNVGFIVPDGLPHGGLGHRYTRRVVTFRACDADDKRHERYTDWPVSGWVGLLLGRGPTCVPINVWVDDEPSPRRTVIPFGVLKSDCDAPS
jgi:hypothetical protein